MQSYRALGLDPSNLNLKESQAVLSLIALRVNPHDIVITCKPPPLLESFLTLHTRLFSLNEIGGLLQTDPWCIGDALRLAIPKTKSVDLSSTKSNKMNDLIQNSGIGVKRAYLFDSQKSYLLIGGIGSLGLHIALWMYQVRLIPFLTRIRC